MADSLAAVVLAAGHGTRLRPLTGLRPKALLPVANVALLDHNLRAVTAVVGEGSGRLAVNAHHLADQIVSHVGDRAHVSLEEPEALGTAGAVARLRPWLDGRAVLVVNGDTWTDVDLAPLVADWDGRQVRVLVSGTAVLDDGVLVLGSLLPPSVVADLPVGPAGLYQSCWRPLLATGELEVVGGPGTTVPCNTAREYLAANLAASGGESVVGAGAEVAGELVRSVVWPGSEVHPRERLVDAIRAEELTVLVR